MPIQGSFPAERYASGQAMTGMRHGLPSILTNPIGGNQSTGRSELATGFRQPC